MKSTRLTRERRKSPRRVVNLETSVVYKDLPIPGCQILNIGFSGACVELPSKTPPINARVRMIIDAFSGKSPITLNGLVVHLEQGKVGVKFVDLTRTLYSDLVDILFRWPISPNMNKPVDKDPKNQDFMLFRRA